MSVIWTTVVMESRLYGTSTSLVSSLRLFNKLGMLNAFFEGLRPSGYILLIIHGYVYMQYELSAPCEECYTLPSDF